MTVLIIASYKWKSIFISSQYRLPVHKIKCGFGSLECEEQSYLAGVYWQDLNR